VNCTTPEGIAVPEKIGELGILVSRKIGREKIPVYPALLNLLREP